MFLTMTAGYWSELSPVTEFQTYSSARKFANKIGGVVDGPFFDYDGNRTYLVRFRVKNFNMKRKGQK